MFFILSKTLAFFTQPSNVLFLLALTGLALMTTRFAQLGKRLLVGGVLLLAILGLSPLGQMASIPLENRFPKWDAGRGAPDGIIVLGGAINPEISAARGDIALGGNAERVTSIAALAKRYPNARIVFTGGNPRLFGGPSEADYVLPLFESFGIARDRVLLERQSRNTIENATMTKALVDPKPGERWLLVTSAHHMPRAVGIFRRVNFVVEPYPVDWHTTGHERPTFPGSFVRGLAAIDAAAHEWIGLLISWLTGRSSDLFPAP